MSEVVETRVWVGGLNKRCGAAGAAGAQDPIKERVCDCSHQLIPG